MRSPRLAGLMLAVGACSALAFPARGRCAPSVDPKASRVLVLPVLEKTGRSGEERDEFVRVGTEALRADFAGLGFAVLPGDAADAAKELRIDLLDDGQRTKESYAKLAQKTGAQFVVAAAIRGVVSGVHFGALSSQKAGKAGIQLAVYDAGSDRFVINGNFVGDKRGSALFAGLDKSSTKRTGALANAFHNGCHEFARAVGIEQPKQTR